MLQNTPMIFVKGAGRLRTCVVVGMIAYGTAWTATAQGERQSRHRTPAEFMSYRGAEWLERSERVDEEQPHRVLEVMNLAPGDVVADIGCGSGYYARRAAPLVQPGGRVYCEDIQPEMLEIMTSLAERDGVDGIHPVLGTPRDPQLPAGEVDWVIIADVYHEMSEPEPMLAGIREALSPEGRVALLEYRVEDGTGDGIKADHAMSVRQVLSEWTDAGFELVALHDFLPSQHLFVFGSTDREPAIRPALVDRDLFAALVEGLVEVEAQGNGDREVSVRIRRTHDQPMVLTSPVGTLFRSEGSAHDMFARRDGWIVLAHDDWYTWTIRAVGRQMDREAPVVGDLLEILPPSAVPGVADVLYQAQLGVYTVADSPTLYIPTTYGVDQAAVWIVDSDLAFDEMVDRVRDDRIPAEYAMAFALVLIDRTEADIVDRRLWAERGRVFDRLRDQGLNVWYQAQSTAQ